jgi:SagB-type dehydrogenase family enzyme
MELHMTFKYITVLCAAGGIVAFSATPAKKPLTVQLPQPKRTGSVSVEDALQGRRSIRTYRKAPLTLADVSQLLWAAYGITRKMDDAPPFLRGGLKTAPSAGALYPLEVYLAAGSVSNLPAGIYKYVPETHTLIQVVSGDKRAALCKAAMNQRMVGEAPVSLIYSAVFERTTRKYGRRGRQRYVCMDLGHSGQNVYLQAYALGLGTCAVGAFDDSSVKKVVGMTADEEPLYIMPVGRRKVTE